jgi:aminoglycoside phosphotransferase (APT) family kinase protein
MLSGENLEKTWSQLNPSDAKSLAFKAGELLKKINGVSFDFFGEIAEGEPFKKYPTWVEYLENKLAYHLNEANFFHFFTDEDIHNIWSHFNSAKEALDQVKQAQLVHVDYHLGNLLHHGGEITGVLDFEWSLAGDPLYDFNRWKTDEDEILPNSQAAFLKGYGQENFTADEKLRMKIYQMIFNIEITVVAHLHFSSEEARNYLETTKKSLNEFKK